MTDVDLDDRGSLLDAFARSEPREQNISNLPVAKSPLPERIVGAQHVAIQRDEEKILNKLRLLAAAAGQDWYYRFPVKSKGGTTEYIEGPSIKLANDLARTFGNCEIETRVVDLGDSWLIYSRFVDLETGFSMTRPFQQRKSQRGMRVGDDRALDIAFQIGASKAIRNVVVNSLQTFADFAFEEARNALVDKIGKNLENYRMRTLEGLANKQIELLRVERVVGRAAKDWTAPDIARVIAMMRSIADGMTTVDETFPVLGAEIPVPGGAQESSAPEGGGAQEQSQPATTDATVAAAHSTTAAEKREEGPPAAANQSDQAEAIAHERGKKDRAKGLQRRAVPGEYRDHSKLAIAWTRGWEEGGK
jgi:hypothetical protein